MDAARWQIVNELFHEVIARAADDRRAWLEQECRGDRTLIDDVDRLIQAHERAGDFLAGSRLSDATALVPGPIGLDFRGTDRFEVRQMLGVGGMGVVYEVYDRERDETVALKTLLRVTPAEMYRLKQEFRHLTDVAHPNLVSLHELFVDSEQCFFTMERVNGVAFGEYVRGPKEPREVLAADRARHVFPQLVEAISELHRRGMLHRDVKPSNVLVTDEGRVVVLDFGLIADISTRGLREQLAGTPAYMAPEQLLGAAPSPASDWYSVGVTLYEALTGRLPFSRSFFEIDGQKTAVDPPARATIAHDVPEDLRAICEGLLCRDPRVRMSGPAAVATLARDSAVAAAAAAPAEAARESLFVGRQRELEVLDEAFARTRAGRLALVSVSGPSGMGKTALVRCFLDRLARRGDVVSLSGRCYENESVPYKALDGMVDSLSRYLMSLSGDAVIQLLPPDSPALGRLFPVLKRVARVAGAERLAQEIGDPLVFRRRAFAALRQLLASIGARQPLVIFVDDLHWADADSAQLFADLLRPPDAPPALVIVCCRSEEIPSKPFLQALLEQAGTDATVILPVGPMTGEEADHLVTALVPPDSGMTLDERQRIALEADGNPFFLDQLTRHASAHSMTPGRGPTLAEVIEIRLRQLTPGAQSFLRSLAICGRPMARSVVRQACGLTGDEQPLVALLRATHLIRSSGSAEHVEVYHDRIREAIVAQLDPETVKAVHAAMATALVSRRIDDPDALLEHYAGAGDRRSAAAYAVRAAEKASGVLAFDRASSLYRRALELAPHAEERRGWNEALALALVNAGRPVDAGEVYLVAAADAPPTERLELRRRAAEQFLIGGHVDRGLDVIRAVLDAAGMRLPRTSNMALASLLLRRLQLGWRGLDFVERSADQVPASALFRIDTCWSVVSGLALVDNLRALAFNTRHVVLALGTGEPYRIARALAIEAFFSAAGGGRARERTARFTASARAIADRVGDPYPVALSALAEAGAACVNGEWRRTVQLAERAIGLFREHCVGATWELHAVQYFLVGALLYLGEYLEASRQLPALVNAAHDAGNLNMETDFRLRMTTLMRLVEDDAAEAERQANEAMTRWSRQGFHVQHYRHLQALGMTALYRGDGHEAWRLIAERWPSVRRSLLLRVQYLRIESQYLRARCALGSAALSGDRRRRLMAVARRDARQLASERMLWSDPMALLLSAGIAWLEERPRLAAARLAEAAEKADLAEMKLYAAVARRRLGSLVGGERASQMVRQADEWMMSQGIRNPPRITRMLAPGFPDEPGV